MSLPDLTLAQAAAAIRNGELSPVDLVDAVLDRIDQVESLVFEEIRRCGREHQNRISRVAISHQRHFHIQIVAKPRSRIASHKCIV